MGWFSDNNDSSGSDSEQQQQQQEKSNNDNEEEEVVHVDPLDAYMNTLKSSSSSSSTRNDRTKKVDDEDYDEIKKNRFDLEDDEAEDFQTHAANNLQLHLLQDDSLLVSVDDNNASGHVNRNSTSVVVPHLLPKMMMNHHYEYEPFRKDFYSNRTKYSNSGAQWRLEHGVIVTTAAAGSQIQTPDPVTEFEMVRGDHNNVLFPDELIPEISRSGYEHPTPIQAQCLSIALSGYDIIGVASTGSGKTLAYVWPMVVHCCDQRAIRPGEDGPIAVILSPTRELALQIFSHAKKMLSAVGGHAVALFGGMGRYEMSKELKRGAECVIGTPGRLIDMVKSKATNLNRCTMVVLDEADTMLAMGFEAQVKSILENIRKDRQTLMFSATFKARIAKLAEFYMKDHIR